MKSDVQRSEKWAMKIQKEYSDKPWPAEQYKTIAKHLAIYMEKLFPFVAAFRDGTEDEHAAWVALEYAKRALAQFILMPEKTE